MNKLELKYTETVRGWNLRKKEVARHKVFETPSEWDELKNAKHLEMVIRFAGVDLPAEMKRVFLLQRLSGMTMKDINRFNAVQMMYVYESVDFLLGKPELTRNHYPQLKHLYGPADGFGNLIIDEFIEADFHFLDYRQAIKENDEIAAEEALDMLIATLWRQRKRGMTLESKDYHGDLREDFNSYSVEARRWAMIRKVKPMTKLGCLYYYQGCREMLLGLFPNVFEGAAEASEHTEPDRESWLKMMAHLPNEKFGTVENVGRLNLLSTFYVLEQMIAKAKKDAAELRARR